MRSRRIRLIFRPEPQECIRRAGTWSRELTSDGAHYALYNDVRYYYDYMDDYQTFFEPVTVTLEEGQYIELMDVSSVEKID